MERQTEKDWSFETNVYVTLLREEIEELKYEHERLQQQIKEKDEIIKKLLRGRTYSIENDKEK